MSEEQHVLVVDGSAETETVLRAVLEPKGVSISRVRSGSAERTEASPTVVVLHEQSQTECWSGVSRVLIGTAAVGAAAPDDHCFDGAFEYRDLVATIDRLLTK